MTTAYSDREAPLPYFSDSMLYTHGSLERLLVDVFEIDNKLWYFYYLTFIEKKKLLYISKNRSMNSKKFFFSKQTGAHIVSPQE